MSSLPSQTGLALTYLHSLAAHRAGIISAFPHRVCVMCREADGALAELIVPSACKSDIDENVPASVKEGIEFVFVDEVRQVLHEVFRGTEISDRWKETLPVEQDPERVAAS